MSGKFSGKSSSGNIIRNIGGKLAPRKKRKGNEAPEVESAEQQAAFALTKLVCMLTKVTGSAVILHPAKVYDLLLDFFEQGDGALSVDDAEMLAHMMVMEGAYDPASGKGNAEPH